MIPSPAERDSTLAPVSKQSGFSCRQRRQKAARTRLPWLQACSSTFHHEMFLKCHYHIFYLLASLHLLLFKAEKIKKQQNQSLSLVLCPIQHIRFQQTPSKAAVINTSCSRPNTPATQKHDLHALFFFKKALRASKADSDQQCFLVVLGWGSHPCRGEQERGDALAAPGWMCESQHQHCHLQSTCPPTPPEAHPTPSILWRPGNSHKLHASQTFQWFSFQALPCTAPRDELIFLCRSRRALDSGWKPLLGHQASSSLTSLPDLESGKYKQWYLRTITPPWSPCLALALKVTSKLAEQATAPEGHPC